MPAKPCLLCRQSQEIKTEIIKLAKTEQYGRIVEWLNNQGIPATYDQTRHWISKNAPATRLSTIPPVKGYPAKVRVYIGALLEYDDPNFTINNIRLRGASWTEVTVHLHADGLIEPMRTYSPMRWKILASKKELRAWLEQQVG
jgi:hypothetical protein